MDAVGYVAITLIFCLAVSVSAGCILYKTNRINKEFFFQLLGLSGISALAGVAGYLVANQRGSVLVFTIDLKEWLPAGIKAAALTAGAFIAVYVCVFLLLSYLHRKQAPVWNYLFRHRLYVICGALSLMSLALMIRYSGVRSLWWDDLCQIGMDWQVSSFHQLVENNLQGDNMPLLYHIIATLWLRIAPYGTIWLKLPSEIAVALGIYFCGLAGNCMRGVRFGILTSFFASISVFLVQWGGYAFRSYGFFFLFSAVTLYLYARRFNNRGKETIANILLFGTAMLLMAYTHYFGILLCGALFLGDLLLWIRKKIRLRCVFSYLLAGAGFLPWGLYVLPYISQRMAAFWPATPTGKTVKATLKTFFQVDSLAVIVAIVLAMVVIAIMYLRQKRAYLENQYITVLPVWCIAFVIGITYLYSAYISPTGSAYVDRYFCCILPCVYMLLAWGTEQLLAGISRLPLKEHRVFPVVLTACLAFTFVKSTYIDTIGKMYSSGGQRFEQSAAWLTQQDDLYTPKTLVSITFDSPNTAPNAVKGWDYYLSRGGEAPLVKPVSSDFFSEESLQPYDTLYLLYAHGDMSEDRYRLLEKCGFALEANHPEIDIKVYVRAKSA